MGDSTTTFIPRFGLARARIGPRALGPARRKVGLEGLPLAGRWLGRRAGKFGKRGFFEALGELRFGMGLGFPVGRIFIPAP